MKFFEYFHHYLIRKLYRFNDEFIMTKMTKICRFIMFERQSQEGINEFLFVEQYLVFMICAWKCNFKRVVFGYVSPLSIHYCLLIHWFLYTNHLSEQKHRESVNNIIMVWINGKNRRGWFLINNESFVCYFWMKTI